MTFLSLFSGIGGLDLGLERAGMKCIGQVEIDPFCRKVLAKHWPDVPKWDDVRTFNAGMLEEKPDLICGGFPCQDISVAGEQAGIDGNRSGLWAEYFRLIREIRPRFALVENVAALLFLGIERVVGNLASVGYGAEWDCLPAGLFGAPHLRRRVFIVATPASVVHALRPRLQGIHDAARRERLQPTPRIVPQHVWSTSPRICGRVDGIPNRMDRLRGLGNAVVPQVAQWIGERILEAEATR